MDCLEHGADTADVVVDLSIVDELASQVGIQLHLYLLVQNFSQLCRKRKLYIILRIDNNRLN